MRDVQLFLGTKKPLSEVAADVCALTGLDLRRDGENYVLDDGKNLGDLFIHTLENNEFPFEDYRYVLQLQAPRDQDVAWCRGVFAKLKASRKFDLLLVEELEERLDEFHPAAAAA